MWDKLLEIEKRFNSLGELLSSAEIIGNRKLFSQYSKEYRDLEELVATFRAYRKARAEFDESKILSESGDDAEIRQMAKDEAALLLAEMEGLEVRLKGLLIPKDPNDEKNILLEIRAGAGGDESGIFAKELLRMYTRYAEGKGWKVELLSMSEADKGIKEVIAMVNGKGAFSRLKYERGVHRVQRVPETEASGRIHTSTVTVAVLPEAEDVEVEIFDKDLRIDVYRAGGPGGQSVNTTDSAVRITHLPSGLVVAMQDEKSQTKNRDKAMKVLRARLFELKQREQDEARTAERRSQVGSGERSEKIRTYNFPQSRVTDHRIGLTIYTVNDIMEGELDQLIEPLVQHHQAEALKSGGGAGQADVQ